MDMQNFSRIFDILEQRKERFGVTCEINSSNIMKEEKGSAVLIGIAVVMVIIMVIMSI